MFLLLYFSVLLLATWSPYWSSFTFPVDHGDRVCTYVRTVWQRLESPCPIWASIFLEVRFGVIWGACEMWNNVRFVSIFSRWKIRISQIPWRWECLYSNLTTYCSILHSFVLRFINWNHAWDIYYAYTQKFNVKFDFACFGSLSVVHVNFFPSLYFFFCDTQPGRSLVSKQIGSMGGNRSLFVRERAATTSITNLP